MFWHEMTDDDKRRIKAAGDVAYRLADCDCGSTVGRRIGGHTIRCAKTLAADRAQPAAEREMDADRARRQEKEDAFRRSLTGADPLPR